MGKGAGVVELESWLKKLDETVDLAHVERSMDLQKCALGYEKVKRLPVSVYFPAPEWPAFTYKEGFYDREKMLLNELASAWVGALAKDDRMYTIRANYGVGIIPSILGCETKLVNDIQMPWTEPLDDVQLDNVLSEGLPDLTKGLGGRSLETEQFYLDTFSRFDNLARTIRIFVCDVQGPFDLAHLVMGHGIYTDVVDRPERVHAVLDLVTDTFIAFAKLQRELIGEPNGFHFHSGHIVRGMVRVCEDSSINLSAAMFREFCRPYDERVLKELGGGWVHYCGAATHMLPEILDLPDLTGINFGNPELQDAESMFRAAKEKRVPVIGWPKDLPGWVDTGVTLIRFAATVDEAQEITKASTSVL